jgi:hypothetical protein
VIVELKMKDKLFKDIKKDPIAYFKSLQERLALQKNVTFKSH